MTKIALITALAASLAAPAFAQSASDVAVENYNANVSMGSDRINSLTFGTQSSNSALDVAVAIHNANADMGSDRINSTPTAFSGTTGRAAEIFARLAAESAEDE